MSVITKDIYYDKNINYKLKKEMFKKILRLKNKICELKNNIENYNNVSYIIEDSILRSELALYKEYLELEIELFKDSYGSYIPSKEELESIKFNENIEYISNIHFYIGGFFQGHDNFFISINHKTSSVTLKKCRGLKRQKLSYEFVDSLNYENLKNQISALNMGEWKSIYDSNSLDGEQWSIKINYLNKINSVKFYGSNSYPYNFDKFLEIFKEPYNERLYWLLLSNLRNE